MTEQQTDGHEPVQENRDHVWTVREDGAVETGTSVSTDSAKEARADAAEEVPAEKPADTETALEQ